uniref:Zinc transporter ZIP11 n=1 Tax=Ditylenchus dipsaci TaxID=166011 RepID=A0A915DGB7_9BILA
MQSLRGSRNITDQCAHQRVSPSRPRRCCQQQTGDSNAVLLVDGEPGQVDNQQPKTGAAQNRQSSKTASFELSPVCLESAEASQTDPLDNGLPNSSSPEMMLSWRRILLLIMAVTVHNIPEGLAVGVGFGSVGKTPAATLKRRLIWLWVLVCKISRKDWLFLCPWLDLDIQRPRHLSLLGAALVILMEPVLPYALAFAAGAMIYVVFDDIIPEAQRNGNGKLASAGTIVGFLVMMCMDVGLG